MHELHLAVAAFKIFVGFRLNPAGYRCFGRTAVGRVILEAAVAGRIVRRGDHYAVRQAFSTSRIPAQNSVRNGGSGGKCPARGNAYSHIVGDQHFQSRTEGSFGKRVRIPTQKERPVNAVGFAIIANCLGNGVNMLFVKGMQHRRTTMPRRAEGYPLGSHRGIGKFGVIRAHQRGNMFQFIWSGQMPCVGVNNSHAYLRRGCEQYMPEPCAPQSCARQAVAHEKGGRSPRKKCQ